MGYVMDFKNPDFLWATVDIAIWSDIEQGLAITAGSLATLRPLWRQVSSGLGMSSSSFGPSTPSGMRTPQWNGDPTTTNEIRKKPSFLSSMRSLFQAEKPSYSVKDADDDSGMVNLAPIRLRYDGSAEPEKSDSAFTSWRIKGGCSDSVCDEETRIGGINTVETHVGANKNDRWR